MTTHEEDQTAPDELAAAYAAADHQTFRNSRAELDDLQRLAALDGIP